MIYDLTTKTDLENSAYMVSASHERTGSKSRILSFYKVLKGHFLWGIWTDTNKRRKWQERVKTKEEGVWLYEWQEKQKKEKEK